MELEHIALRSGRLSSFLKGELNMSTGLMNRLKWTGALLVNGQPARPTLRSRRGTDHRAAGRPRARIPGRGHAPGDPLRRPGPSGGGQASRYPDPPLPPPDDRDSGQRRAGVLPQNRPVLRVSPGYPAGPGYLRPGARWPRIPTSTGSSMTFTPRGICIKSTTAWCTARRRGRRGTVDMPIGRCPKPSLLRRIDPQGQPARTRYRLLEQGPHWSLLELEPLTGRTHQLRVHCTYLGCPCWETPVQYTGKRRPLRPPGPHLPTALRPGASLPHPMTGTELFIQSSLRVKSESTPAQSKI